MTFLRPYGYGFHPTQGHLSYIASKQLLTTDDNCEVWNTENGVGPIHIFKIWNMMLVQYITVNTHAEKK